MHSRLFTRDKILSAPATRGDCCSQSFNEGAEIKRDRKRVVCHFRSKLDGQSDRKSATV